VSEQDTVRARLSEDCADIQIGDRQMSVDRRDNSARANTCPIELVSAALGS
jgi:hypothetical protein